MKYDDPYKYMISGYYGIDMLDEYDNKAYILHSIKNYINLYLEKNKIDGFNYDKLNEEIKNNTSLVHKLEDALLVLKDINAPVEISIIVRQKLNEMKKHKIK